MKVIITFTFCCGNLWKSKFMALEKPGKLRTFFLLLCGHPDSFFLFFCIILLYTFVSEMHSLLRNKCQGWEDSRHVLVSRQSRCAFLVSWSRLLRPYVLVLVQVS